MPFFTNCLIWELWANVDKISSSCEGVVDRPSVLYVPDICRDRYLQLFKTAILVFFVSLCNALMFWTHIVGEECMIILSTLSTWCFCKGWNQHVIKKEVHDTDGWKKVFGFFQGNIIVHLPVNKMAVANRSQFVKLHNRNSVDVSMFNDSHFS